MAIDYNPSRPSFEERVTLLEEEITKLKSQLEGKCKIISDYKEINQTQKAQIIKLVADQESIIDGELLKTLAFRIRAEIKKAAAEAVSESNTYNFHGMAAYTHRTFIESIQKHAPMLVYLLGKILVTVPEDAQNSSSPRQASRNHTLAAILAWFMENCNNHFSWQFMSVVQVIVRSLARSPFVTNLLGFLCPGACCSTTLTRRLEQFVDHIRENQLPVDGNSTAIWGHDNCPNRHGYIARTTRGGIDQKNTAPVACSCTVLHIFGEEEEAVSLQKFAKYSPRYDDMSPIPPDLHHLRDSPWPEDAKLYPDLPFRSEKEHLEAEILGFLQERLCLGDWKTVVHQATKKDSKFVQEATKALGELPSEKPCRNKACSLTWPLSKQICNGATGCGTTQYTQKEFISQLIGLAEDEDDVIEKVNIAFEKPRRQATYRRRDKIAQLFEAEKVKHEGKKKSHDLDSTFLDKILLIDQENDNNAVHATTMENLQSKLARTIEKNDILNSKAMRYEVLLTLFENPNSKQSIKRILTRYLFFLCLIVAIILPYLLVGRVKFFESLVSCLMTKCRDSGCIMFVI